MNRRWVKRRKYRKVTPEIKEKMEALRKEGLSFREIARKLGVATSTVGYHLYEEYRILKIKREKERYRKKKEKLAS